MELHFTHNSATNTTLYLAEGQALYKIETPFSLGKRTTTISKVVPDDDDDILEKGEKDSLFTLKDSLDTETVTESEIVDLQDTFAVIGEIDWRNIGHNKLRFGGVELAPSSNLWACAISE
jgi:hypothetical protein